MADEKQIKPYKTIEERIFVDSGIRDFLVYSGKGLYGAVATMFRFPTAIRKNINNQTFLYRDYSKIEGKLRHNKSITLGVCIGGCVDAAFFGYSSYQALNKGNYLPFAVLGAANLLSWFFELGRASKSKQENLELKAEREAEKVQTQTEKPTEKN